MHPFDEWLLERLVAVGALCLGDTSPDVAAALSLYQESEGLPKTAFADDATVNMLRRQYSPNPEIVLDHFSSGTLPRRKLVRGKGILAPMTFSTLASRIDRAVLMAIAPKGNRQPSGKQAGIIAGFADLLPDLLPRFAVTSALRIEHLLSQVAHECDGFLTLEEYASGKAYEGRKDLGNTQPGDGARFKGRSPLQLTGRDNYRKFTVWLRAYIPDCPDFEAQSEFVGRFPWAAWAVFYYWAAHGLNAIADADDLVLMTRRINGGTNGLADRRAYLAKAKLVVGKIEASLIAVSQSFPVLMRGAEGDAVETLQPALRATGHYLLSIDGDFGPGTEGAVKTLQRSLGLTIDGKVGRLTWAALEPYIQEEPK